MTSSLDHCRAEEDVYGAKLHEIKKAVGIAPTALFLHLTSNILLLSTLRQVV